VNKAQVVEFFSRLAEVWPMATRMPCPTNAPMKFET